MRVELVQNPEPPQPPTVYDEQHVDPTTGLNQVNGFDSENFIAAPEDRRPEDPSTWGKIGRNEACPCGSGKKYKHCHGAFEQA
jgi:preprotein translocase subunit SecA